MTFHSSSPEHEADHQHAAPDSMDSSSMASMPPPPVQLQAGNGFGAESEDSSIGNEIKPDGPTLASAQLSVSEESSALPIQGKFTVSASLSAQGDSTFDAYQVHVDAINMPEQDRPDTQFGDKQRSHGVAWTSMFGAWRRMFTGPLHQVIATFKDMARKDHSSDQNESSRLLREQAWSLLEGWEKASYTVSEWMQRLNRAISLYIEAYQKSSFSTHNTKPGGRGEPHAKKELEEMEAKTMLASETGSSHDLNPMQILEHARKLVDITFRQKPDQIAKVYEDWIEMLHTNYSHIGEIYLKKIVEEINATKLSPGLQKQYQMTTLGELLFAWKTSSMGVGSSLGTPTIAAPKSMDFTVNSKMSVSGQATFTMDQIHVSDIALSEGDRPDTQFGDRQLSHFVAWTGKIMEWRQTFSGCTMRVALQRLWELAQHDQATDKNPKSIAIRRQLGVLSSYLKDNPRTSVSSWTVLLNNAVTTYVEAYQLASSTTHSDKPGSRGEPAGKKFLSELEEAMGKGGGASKAPADVIRAAKFLLDAPFDKGMEFVCKAYDDWMKMVAMAVPRVWAAYKGHFEADLKKTAIPPDWASSVKVNNLFDLLLAWRKSLKLPEFGLPMGSGKVHDPETKVDYLAPSQDQNTYMGTQGLNLVRIANDGDCLYNSLLQSGVSGLPGSVQALRNAVAGVLEKTDAGEADAVRRGDWVGHGADSAPGILAQLYDLNLVVVHPNAYAEPIGNGSRRIYLILIQGPPQHYHLAR